MQFSYALAAAGKKLTEEAQRDMTILAREFLAETDAQWPRSTQLANGAKFGGDHYHPWYSGQLHDSVAVRIAQGNRTVSVSYMPPAADPNRPQHTSAGDGSSYGNIIGVEWAREVAEHRAPYYFLPGVQMQLIVGVPYTDKVNESGRHYGFFDNLSNELINKVDDWLNTGGLQRRRIVADVTPNGKVMITTKQRIR